MTYGSGSSVAAVSVSALTIVSENLNSAGEKASAANLLVLNGADPVVAVGGLGGGSGGVTTLGALGGTSTTAVVFSTTEDGETETGSRSCGHNSGEGEDGSESELHFESR